jgi:hypothetical protein
MVMLLTVLTVAFMMRAGSEKQSSGYYRAEATTRELSDTTLNLVEGEINEATTQGVTYAWASQPGAIRVYDNNGAPYKTFKLYSATSMVATTGTLTGASGSVASFFSPDIPTASWISAPGMWVDLNAPTNSDPNPNAAGLGSPAFTHFPILDPRDPALAPVNAVTAKLDGFSITGAPTDSTSKIDSNGGPNLAPMPVKWLYVLQDGTVTAPTSGPDASGNYLFTITPSSSNPIVGRIAFWTDDETCKVNINTAAGDGLNSTTNPYPINVASGPADGTKAAMFWSTPYFYSNDDINLAIYQPFQGEFQRYPGHPGTVSFNNILNSLGNTIAGSSFYNNPSATTPTFGITPRYTYNPPISQAGGTVGATTPILSLSNSRLYPTVAEMLFQPARTQSAVNPGSPSAKSRQQEETARFFLSAHSRAPELNLFGLPRVSIWPISYPNPTSTPAPGVAPPTSSSASAPDKLLAFDSSISTNPYYFSRIAAGGPNYPNGQQWYNVPSPTGCQSTTLDINIPRNTQLLNYLDYLTQQQLPGYGGYFGGSNSKYGQWGMHQILTEIFDYIRITDLIDSHFVTYSGTPGVGYRVGLNGSLAPPLPYASAWEQPYGYAFGQGQVVPSYYSGWQTAPVGALGATTGEGTLPVLTEVTIHFVALGDSYKPKYPKGDPRVGQYVPLTNAAGTPLFDSKGNPRYPHPNAIPPREWLGGLLDPRNPDPTTQAGTDYGILNSPVPFDGSATTGIATDYDHCPDYPSSIPAPPPAPNAVQPPYDTYGEGIVAPSSVINTGVNPDGTPKADGTRVAVQAFVYLQWVFPAAWHYGQNLALNYEISGLDGLDISTAPGDTTSATPLASFYQGLNTSTSPPTYRPMDGVLPNDLPAPSTILQFCAQPSEAAAIVGTNQGIGTDHMRMDWAASQGPLGIAQSTGYYPCYGMTGSQTTAKLLAPTNPIDHGNGFAAPNQTGYYFGSFPFYSSVFTVDRGTLGSQIPFQPVDTSIVVKARKPLLIKLYRGDIAGPAPGTGDPNLYATYTVQFPATNRFPIPTVDTNAYRIIGTQLFQPGSEPPGDERHENDERWWTTQENVGSGQQYFFDPSDVVQSMVLNSNFSDFRMLLAGSSANPIPSTAYTTAPQLPSTNSFFPNFAHSLISTGIFPMPGAESVPLVPGVPAEPQYPNWYAAYGSATGYSVAPYASPTILSSGSSGFPGAYTNKGANGDWDNGMGGWGDGPWINKADEGSLPDIGGYTNYYPYFTVGNGTETNYQALFSPNKEIPSPVMFGSLPTGVPDLNAAGTYPAEPWQTLLFRPGPGQAGLTAHPGEAGYQRDGSALAGAPPDHVLLDLFWMPVAEPYAISEPYSTAGKINLNYQILPFTYIKRATALRAALASEMVARSAAVDGSYYKKITGLGINYPINAAYTGRLPINLDETTSQFDTKFSNWDVFHSASQICDIFLVPKGTDQLGNSYAFSTFPAKWYDVSNKGDFALVGDNVRERPYADLYQKVTTKSNTYTVYYRVQSLKEPASLMASGKWNENLGTVTGEYRGSSTIERFIDVNEGTYTGGVFTSTIPDAASQIALGTAPTSLEGYYKWRVVENHQFAP